MDTTILRLALGIVSVIAAAYLVWPQVAIWLDRVKQPVCGNCRYAVAGITGLKCPECGSNFCEVGILTPGMMMRRKPGRGTWVAGWTLAWALAGVIATVVVSMAVQGKLRALRSNPLTNLADSGAKAEIVQTSEGWTDPPSDRVIEVKLRHDTRAGVDGELEFTWPDRAVVRAEGSAAGLNARTVDADVLTAWVAGVGIPQPQDAGPQLLDAVAGVTAQPVNMATDVASGTAWMFSGSTISVRRYTPWWVQVAGGGGWVVLWAIGAVVIGKWADRRNPREV